MKRLQKGMLFGQNGIYVSQPGDNLDSPTKALLLDSRSDCLEIHTTGLASLPQIGEINGVRTYSRTVTFPSLGYVPRVTWGIVLQSQYICYPPSIMVLDDNALYFFQDSYVTVTASSLQITVTIEGTANLNLDLFYVIYRNPSHPTVLSPSGTERVFIGNDGGTFKMRVSKPGYVARSATRDQCSIHEDKRPLIPVATGVVSVPAHSPGNPIPYVDTSAGTSFSFPPKIIRRDASGVPAGIFRLTLNTGALRVYNINAPARNIRYAVYHPA